MARHTSRVAQRVDQVEVTDEPHDEYYESDPVTGAVIAQYDADGNVIRGIPILCDTRIGMVVKKSVTAYTVHCPDCDVPARYDESSEPVCPSCGLICDGQQGEAKERHPNLLIDAKAAGRMPNNHVAHP